MLNIFKNSQEAEVEKITPSKEAALRWLNKAVNKLSFVKKATGLGEGEEEIYEMIYDVRRIGCEAILAFYGYRVKSSGPGHHKLVIKKAAELISPKLRNEFFRLEKMRGIRNKLEYGNEVSVSEQELKQAYEDGQTLLKEVSSMLKEPERPMI